MAAPKKAALNQNRARRGILNRHYDLEDVGIESEIEMPTIHREGGYRFFFYAADHAPPHVHVERDGREAKFLLRPVRLASNDGFTARDLAKIERMVHNNAQRFEEAWHGHFGKPT